MNDFTTSPWFSAHLQEGLELIDRFGHLVQGVNPRPGVPALYYTVGLSTQTEHGYELALSGLGFVTGERTLNAAAAELRARAADPVEGLVLEETIVGYTAVLREADTSRRFGMITQLTGLMCPVWQVVWPDANHLFPGDPGCVLTCAEQQDLSQPPQYDGA